METVDVGVAVAPQLEPADPSDEATVLAAVDLGRLCSRTVGFLPAAAYQQAASAGTLLIARVGTDIVGYAHYAIARDRIRLTHLCVRPDCRRNGIARALVERISGDHRDRQGILARCRHDYDLAPLWSSLGFYQLSERPGRGRGGHVLVNWWRDHGHPTLFTVPVDDILVRASVDLNVLRDLADPSRPNAQGSLAIADDEYADRLDLARTPALAEEIASVESGLRSDLTRHAQRLSMTFAQRDEVERARNRLLAAIGRTSPGYPATEQERMDLRYVAESCAARLNVFITRDEDLIRVLGSAAEDEAELRLLRPTDVIIHIDELVRAEAYRPVAFLGSDLVRRAAGVRDEGALSALRSQSAKEKPKDFRRLLSRLASSGIDRIGIFAEDGSALAVYAVTIDGIVCDVPLLRVGEGPLENTLALQLMLVLRIAAREAGAMVIRISDPAVPSAVVSAAVRDGFRHDGDGLVGFVIDVASDAREIEETAAGAALIADVRPPDALRPGLPGAVASEIERGWWPAKLLDSELGTYLVPIRPGYAVDLLGLPEGLFPRLGNLGLSREHVYYRSPAGPGLTAPARILWYVSGSRRHGQVPTGVAACSQLEGVFVGSPEEMHSRFRHLGVWDLQRISRVTRRGQVQALRFSNTEPFERAVPIPRLRELGTLHGRNLIPQGPMSIGPEVFGTLYREGRGRG